MTDENTTTEETAAATPNFGISDLVFTLQLYEACSQRGAFRAEELTNVGAAYDRLRAFLISNGAIPTPGAATPPAADAAQGE